MFCRNKVHQESSSNTEGEMQKQTQDQLIKDIIKMSLYVLAVLLNCCLLFMIWRDPIKRFRNATSFTIANLAFADIIAALGGLGGSVSIVTNRSLTLHKVFGCITTAGLQSLFTIITILAFDRYLAISHPYRYREIRFQRTWSVVLNIAAWLVAWTISPVIYLVSLGLPVYYLYVANIALLALVTIVLYPLNYVNFLREQQRMKRLSKLNARTLEDIQLAKQLNHTWMIVGSFLTIAMAPYVYQLVININDCISCLLDDSYVKFWSNYQVVVPAILFVNPLIFAWRLPLYRKAFKALFLPMCSRMQNTAEASSTRGSSND